MQHPAIDTGRPAFPPATGEPPAPARALGAFASFALALSTICILAGGITSFPVGFCSVGGASIGIGWPMCCLFSLAVALTMGQVASAFPRAGGPSEWAAELGGDGWGWIAGCFNLAGLITATAAVNVGCCEFVIKSLAALLGQDSTTLPAWILDLAVAFTTISQAFINHRGIRLTTLLTDFSSYLIVVVAAALTLLLILSALLSDHGLVVTRLVEFTNYSGAAGGGVLPPVDNLAWLFALGLLLPAYTITGFDVSAQTSEETRHPEINVPRAIWRAVLISGVAGWIMLSALVLAAPDMDAAARAGERSFFWIIDAATPYWTHGLIYTGVSLAQYFCALACITAASRLTWAMSRDGGLPGARWLRRIGTHRTPTAAIWASCAVIILFAKCVALYSAIAAVCAVFFYIAYVIPTACGLATYGRWPRTGPWHLGAWYPPLAVVCVLGCVGLTIVGMQPPNEIAGWVVGAMIVALVALWFSYFRYKFRDEMNRALRKLAAFRDYHEATVEPLGDGAFRVDLNGQSYLLHIAQAGSARHRDRPRELAASQAAAAAGVAPDVIEHHADHTLVVTRFVHGTPLTLEHLRHTEVLRRAAQTLRRYHDHPPPDDLAKFSPFEALRRDHALAKLSNVFLPAELDEAMRSLAHLEKETPMDEAACLCHNALLPGNFIDEGDVLRVIAWKHAGLGSRYYDLGSFAAHSQLGAIEERMLLEHYFGAVQAEDLRRLQAMRLLSDLRDAMRAYAQSATVSLEDRQRNLDLARIYLDRFLSAAAGAGPAGS